MARARFATTLGALLAVLLAGCQRQDAVTPAMPMALPALAAAAPTLDQLQLVGAGNRVLWTLRKHDGSWHVLERADWPAANGQVGQLLLALSQLRLADARTDDPARYPRIGVEDVAAADAAGVELRLGRGPAMHRLLVGHDGQPDGSFVRVDGDRRSWLTNASVEIARDPAQWLARDLIDRPLARIESVEVRQADGPPFRLRRERDRFLLEGARGASAQAESLAGGLDQLKLDDVARDEPAAVAEREVRFVGVDGVDVTLALWRRDGQVWARLATSLDEARARAWAAQSPTDPARQLAAVHAQLDAQQARYAGRCFRLVPLQAVSLMLGRLQLAAAPP